MLLSPLITALITPFKKDTSLDLERFNALIRWQEESGVEDIVILGSTGEAFSLTDKERSKLIESAVSVKTKARIFIGCTAFTEKQAKVYAKEAETLGACGIMLAPPPYSKPSQEGLLQTMLEVLDSTSLQALLYTVPSRTCVTIAPKTFAELLKHPKVIGIKDASGDLNYSTELLQQIAETNPSCRYYCGDDAASLPLLSLGAYGTISVISNLVPKTFSCLISFAKQGKQVDALALHRALYPLMKGLFITPNPTAVKALASLLDLCQNVVRLPHVPASKEVVKSLMKFHKELKLNSFFCDHYPF